MHKQMPDARLVVKTQSGTHGHLEFDPKACGDIEIIDAIYTQKQMRELMKDADCFVFPTHGEGFGLPPIEAAATGLPTIVARNTGMLDYADLMYSVSSDKKEPAKRYPKEWGDVGNWYVPDFDELKERMLWIYQHQSEANAFALANVPKIRERFDYRTLAQQIIDAINKHMQ
jgi:glycosyltransferase involved in cell wall biosynthesis